MQQQLLEVLACPACRCGELALHVFDRDETRIEAGYLVCQSCRRLYFVVDGIPRMLTEDYADLLNLRLADHPRFPDVHRGDLDRWRERVESRSESSRARWGIEDVAYWDDQVYGSPELERVRDSRPDAGNRMWPREQHIFSHLRERVGGKVVIDLGCGVSQAVRVLADPAKVGYHYVGCDLSLNALKVNRSTMEGDFVQCSASDLPFRESCAAAVLMLGVLHHLPDQDETVSQLLTLLEPGGLIAFHEVTKRRAKKGARSGESAHNDAVDADTLLKVLSSRGSLIAVKRENSRLRWVLTTLLDERMRTSPWLTRTVIGLDDAFNATIGKLLPSLGPSSVIVLARARS